MDCGELWGRWRLHCNGIFSHTDIEHSTNANLITIRLPFAVESAQHVATSLYWILWFFLLVCDVLFIASAIVHGCNATMLCFVCFFSLCCSIFNCSRYGHVVEQHFFPFEYWFGAQFFPPHCSFAAKWVERIAGEEPCSLAELSKRLGAKRNRREPGKKEVKMVHWKCTISALVLDGNRAIKIRIWFIYLLCEGFSLWCAASLFYDSATFTFTFINANAGDIATRIETIPRRKRCQLTVSRSDRNFFTSSSPHRWISLAPPECKSSGREIIIKRAVFTSPAFHYHLIKRKTHIKHQMESKGTAAAKDKWTFTFLSSRFAYKRLSQQARRRWQ